MSLRELLFPATSRSFRGQRWSNILLRTLHLVGVTGMGAGVLFAVPQDAWQGYLLLTLVSGFLLVAIALWSSAIWLCQVRGAAILLKLALLALIPWWPAAAPALLLATVVISGLVSHAPSTTRTYSLCHRQPLDTRRGHGHGRRGNQAGADED
jgi:hypothetical protein